LNWPHPKTPRTRTRERHLAWTVIRFCSQQLTLKRVLAGEMARPRARRIFPACNMRDRAAPDRAAFSCRPSAMRALHRVLTRPLRHRDAECCSASISHRVVRSQCRRFAGRPDAVIFSAGSAAKSPRNSRRILPARA